MDENDSEEIQPIQPEVESGIKKHFFTITFIVIIVVIAGAGTLSYFISKSSTDMLVVTKEKEVEKDVSFTKEDNKQLAPIITIFPYEWGEGGEIPVDWNEYTNEEYGYSFRYPDYLELTENTSESRSGVSLRIPSEFRYPNLGGFEVVIDSSGAPVGKEEGVLVNGYYFANVVPPVTKGIQSLNINLLRDPVLYESDKFRTLRVRAWASDKDTSLSHDLNKVIHSFTYSAKTEVPAWKEFKSSTLGFELLMPDSYMYTEYDDHLSAGIPKEERGEGYGWTLGGSVSVTTTTPGMTFNDLINQEQYAYTTFDENVYVIDGHEALRGQSNEADGTVSFWIILDDTIYQITQGLTQGEILSSFRFLDNDSSSSVESTASSSQF